MAFVIATTANVEPAQLLAGRPISLPSKCLNSAAILERTNRLANLDKSGLSVEIVGQPYGGLRQVVLIRLGLLAGPSSTHLFQLPAYPRATAIVYRG